jgi:hypothetical protein
MLSAGLQGKNTFSYSTIFSWSQKQIQKKNKVIDRFLMVFLVIFFSESLTAVGLLGKANQRFTLLGLDLKTLMSDNEGVKEEKDAFTIDDLRDNPNLQFRYALRSSILC